MDGIEAIKLIPGFNILYKLFGQYSAIKMAVKIPMGTPIIVAPRVTYIEPKIIGDNPKLGELAVGRQTVPNKNSLKPYFLITGIPLVNMNTIIRTNDTIDIKAEIKKMPFITRSFCLNNRIILSQCKMDTLT